MSLTDRVAPGRVRPLPAIGAVVLLACLLLGVVAAHMCREGERSLGESDSALASGDVVTAIERARDAALDFVPFTSYADQGLLRLEDIARKAEARGAFDHATLAWRAVWVAVRATRTEERHGDAKEKAKEGLVRLAMRACEGGQTRAPSACAATVEATLAEDDLPDVSRFAWLGLGALALFGGGGLAAETSDPRRRIASLLAMAAGAVAVTLTLLLR